MKHKKEADLLPHYDNKMKYYSPANAKELPRIMELAGVVPVPGQTFLDIGCGDGRACTWARKHHLIYSGIDYSKKRIERATELHKGDDELVYFGAGDLYEVLPKMFAPRDIIWCCELLEHLEEPEIIWAEMKRLCSGIVVCTCPVDMPYEAHLQVFKTDDDLHAIFPDITEIKRITCRTPGGKQREHFVFTYVAE